MADYLMIPELLRVPGLFHGFGTRRFAEEDLRVAAAANGAVPVLLRQVHSDHILVLDRAPADVPEADGVASARPGLALVVKTADCLPLFLVDPEHGAAAAVHAGWRGTARGIAAKAVGVMTRSFETRPAALLVALGPCIGGACYEVGEEVAAAFEGDPAAASRFVPVPGRPGKYLFDLRAANRDQLTAAGVPGEAIFEAGACTHCDPTLLSYRRDRRSDLRLFNFVGFRG